MPVEAPAKSVSHVRGAGGRPGPVSPGAVDPGTSVAVVGGGLAVVSSQRGRCDLRADVGDNRHGADRSRGILVEPGFDLGRDGSGEG